VKHINGSAAWQRAAFLFAGLAQSWIHHAVVSPAGCYDCDVFNFGNPKTPGQWIGHIVVAVIGLFLIWWMLRLFIL